MCPCSRLRARYETAWNVDTPNKRRKKRCPLNRGTMEVKKKKWLFLPSRHSQLRCFRSMRMLRRKDFFRSTQQAVRSPMHVTGLLTDRRRFRFSFSSRGNQRHFSAFLKGSILSSEPVYKKSTYVKADDRVAVNYVAYLVGQTLCFVL